MPVSDASVRSYSLLVLTNAAEGQDVRFNSWYDEVHVRDVTAIPGIDSARRFVATAAQPTGDAPKWRYMAHYSIETADLAGVLAEMNARAGTEAMVISDSLDVGNVFATVFEALPAAA